jgi:DNA-binding NarL/FixJ family response regulator
MPDTIKVFIVDDHLVVREGITSVLDYEKSIQVIGQASDARDALAQIEKISPDIILMDLRMPGIDGIQLTKMIINKKPSCKIIVLTLYDQFIGEAMAAGARGYLLKDINREDLINSIKKVYAGEIVYDKKVNPAVKIEYEELPDDETTISKVSSEEMLDTTSSVLYDQVKLFIIPPTNISDSLKLTSITEEALSADFTQVEGTAVDGISITFKLYKSISTQAIINRLSNISFIKVLDTKELAAMDSLKMRIQSKRDYDLRHPLLKTIFIKLI